MFRKIAVLLVVVSLGAIGAQGASILFPARSDIDAGSTSGTSHVATVDVDGDGVTDLVVVALSEGAQDLVDPELQVGVQVFESDRRGLFLPPTTLLVPLNSFPGKIVSGDFDGDGDRDDIAVAVEDLDGSVGDPLVTAGGVLVFTRDAGVYTLFAKLQGRQDLPSIDFEPPGGLTAGQFGGGAADDLVKVNSASGNFSVFINSSTAGNPAFTTTHITSGPCATPVAVASGQLDVTPGDDLAIVCDSLVSDDSVQTWKNVGGGTFTLFPEQPATDLNAPRAVIIADLNNDGRNDIAIANSFLDAPDPDGRVTLLRNFDGLGGFIEFTANGAGGVPVGASPVSLDAGDPNGDGIIDLLTANLDDEDISVLTGSLQGAGTVAQPSYDQAFFTGGLFIDLWEAAFANLDNAGNGDVVSAHANELTATLSSFLGSSSSVLSAATRYFPTDNVGDARLSVATALAVGDFDGDTIADLAVTNFGNDTVTVFRATPGGATPFQLLDLLVFDFDDTPVDLLAEDVNGDGFLDIVTLLAPGFVVGEVATFLNNGSGSFPSTPNFIHDVGNLPFTMARADMDGDTITDLVISNLDDQTVTILKGLTSGGHDAAPLNVFDVTQGSPCAEGSEEDDCDPAGLALADVNGDGDIDMVVSLLGGVDGGTLRVFNNDGAGTLTGGQEMFSIDAFGDQITHTTVFFSDLDGINGPDIVAIGFIPDDLVSVFLNNGAGGFDPAPGSPFLVPAMDMAAFEARNALVTDMNDDGVPDLVVTGFFSNNVALMLGAGDGTFFTARADAFGTTAGPVAVGAGDVNDDGLVDLVVVSQFKNDVAILDSGLDDRADVNGSGRSDGIDLAILSRRFGIDSSDPDYDFYFDIDADGDLDGMDIALLSLFFGLSFL